jgi:hypothetical protein
MAHIELVIDSINKNIKDGADFAIDSIYMHDIIQNWNYKDIIHLLRRDIKNFEIIGVELIDTLINLNKLDIFKIIIKQFSFSYQLPTNDSVQFIILNHINYGYDSYLILLKYMYTIGTINISFEIYNQFTTSMIHSMTKLLNDKIFI